MRNGRGLLPPPLACWESVVDLVTCTSRYVCLVDVSTYFRIRRRLPKGPQTASSSSSSRLTRLNPFLLCAPTCGMGPDGVVMSHWGLPRRVVMTRGGQVRRTGLKETGLGSGGGGGGFGGGGGRHQVSEYARRLPTTTTATERGVGGAAGEWGQWRGRVVGKG